MILFALPVLLLQPQLFLPEALINRKPSINWARIHPRWIITASAHKSKAVQRAQFAGRQQGESPVHASAGAVCRQAVGERNVTHVKVSVDD